MQYHIECPNKDYDLILTEYKEIPLTQGKVALVDVEDYEYLNQWKWYAWRRKNIYYAVRNMKKDEKRTSLYVHQEILKPLKGMQIDHINGDELDNRRDNLRFCDKSQNGMNRGKQKNNKSGYKGVSWDNRDKIWRAQIKINREKVYLGNFLTKEEAALAYNEGAIKYHGEFARLNEIRSKFA